EFFPENYNIGETELWLDNVVFAELYMKENIDGEVTAYNIDADGTHLKGTVFESSASVKADPGEEDWHRHSYAMNANLQYDRIYDQVQSPDPWLTEKSLSNLVFAPNAMVIIDCAEKNVVMFEDREFIIDAATERWGEKGKVIVGFLDGHAERIAKEQIPDEDPQVDRLSSRFWRGVDVIE
ncbi:MAG: hypothetical protein AAGC68_09360, partial [Verrucomicrobiota bacterium]